MSLLEKALQEKSVDRVSLPVDKEHIELAVAVFSGLVGISQASKALGYDSRHQRMNTLNRLTVVLMEALKQEKAKLTIL